MQQPTQSSASAQSQSPKPSAAADSAEVANLESSSSEAAFDEEACDVRTPCFQIRHS